MAGSAKAIEMSNIEKDFERRNMDVAGKAYSPGVLILFITEVLGTAMLLFLGCMGTSKIVGVPDIPQFGGVGFGLTVLIIIQALGHISGAHLNPQVTIAAVILGKTKPTLAPVYFLAEFVGALAGFGLLKLVLMDNSDDGLCNTIPKLPTLQSLLLEVVITFILVVVCGGVWDKRNANYADSVPIRFGFIIAGISIVAGPYTGASMNTARSFAPALIHGDWNGHWIYWVGPTVGAVIGATFYRFVLGLPKQQEHFL